MTVVYLLLLCIAGICFLAATLGATVRRVNLVPLGLLFWVAVPFLATFQSLLKL